MDTASVFIDVISDDDGATNYDGYLDQVDFRVGGLPNDLAVALQDLQASERRMALQAGRMSAALGLTPMQQLAMPEN